MSRAFGKVQSRWRSVFHHSQHALSSALAVSASVVTIVAGDGVLIKI